MRALLAVDRSPMKNQLHVGFKKKIEKPKGWWLSIDDEVAEHPKGRVFDPLKHCFNPLRGLDYKRARELAELLYTISPQGDNTLTVRNGKRALLKALLKANRLDRVKGPKGDEEVGALIADILVSPVLRKVLCTDGQDFSFSGPNAKISARINRVELGDFDALVLGLLLMSHFEGQLVVPDLGFYGRDIHSRLIREERLIAGVNFLDELPHDLRKAVLLIGNKVPAGTTVEDAEELAKYERLPRRTNGFIDFVANATA
jgi:hypothetical protein